jgi:hypothetical protein
MKSADRLAGAQAFLADLPDEELAQASTERVQWCCRVTWRQAEKLLHAELLKRGLITLSDLSPPQRRALIDPDNLDLKTIAAGPIMDAAQLYLPAGKISAAETAARERAAVQKL